MDFAFLIYDSSSRFRNGMGIETGIDLEKLVDAGYFICLAIGKEPSSKVAVAMMAQRA